MKSAVALVIIGFVTAITGIAVIHWPTALIAAGLFLMAAGLYIDFDSEPE